MPDGAAGIVAESRGQWRREREKVSSWRSIEKREREKLVASEGIRAGISTKKVLSGHTCGAAASAPLLGEVCCCNCWRRAACAACCFKRESSSLAALP